MLMSQIRVDPMSDAELTMSDAELTMSPRTYHDLFSPPTRSPSPFPFLQHSRYFFSDVIADFMVSTEQWF